MEGFLDRISYRSHRVCYSKMRISNHRFAMETGRFRKIPRDERCCLYCKKQSIAVIEDEKHILLHCPLYEQYRKQLYGSVDELCPNFKDLKNGDQLNYLLNSDVPIVKAVARFFYNAITLNKREIDRVYKNDLYIATVSIKQKAVDRIKTALRFWFNATRISARMTSKTTTFVTSISAIVIERYVNEQTDEKKVILQRNALS